MTMDRPLYDDRERLDEIAFTSRLDLGYDTVAHAVRQMSDTVVMRQKPMSLADVPVDHRMLGRGLPVVPPAPVTNSATITKTASMGKTEMTLETVRKAMASLWSPPPVTSQDLWNDWQRSIRNHRNARF